MTRIIANDFCLLIKKEENILNELTDNINILKQKISKVNLNLNNDDLKFLKNKLDLEVNQLNNVMKKTKAYQDVLNSVYNSYQKQAEQMQVDLRKLIS